MAEDYLTDDEQLDALKVALVEYAPWLIGGVVIGAAVFFGFRYFQSHVTERAIKAATQFSAMSVAMQGNEHAKSRQIAEGIIHDYGATPYADQAQLALARLAVDDGQSEKAIAPLTQVMNNSKDSDLRQIARLRLARVLTDEGKPDQAISTLADPIPPAFSAPYHEARGDAYLAKKDLPHATAEYQAALAAADLAGLDSSLLELKLQDLGGTAPMLKTVSADTPTKVER
jgi:predicted negative regulator of RcsB-dependent stress response